MSRSDVYGYDLGRSPDPHNPQPEKTMIPAHGPTTPPPVTKWYTKTTVDRCVGAAHDVLLGPPHANTRDYENGVKDALRLFQTALALTA